MGILFLTSWEFQESDYVAANSLLFSSESTVYKFTSQWPRINELCPWSGLKTVARIFARKRGEGLTFPFLSLSHTLSFFTLFNTSLKSRIFAIKNEIGKNHCKFCIFWSPVLLVESPKFCAQNYNAHLPVYSNNVVKFHGDWPRQLRYLVASTKCCPLANFNIAQHLRSILWCWLWKMPFGPKPLNRSCWNLASIISR